ncbi:MAG: corrinoid protein [Candidatus Hadarchaeum sp.]|uniref:cobalamin B12-binding domain-containing protein n=1 Tax=Candidatus Hadarchaeum sp. TaxID=2883567 RepID=UPI00317DB07B
MFRPVDKIREAMSTFDQEKLIEVAKGSLKNGFHPLEIINAITVVLREMGEKYEKGEIFIPHLVTAGEAAKYVISELLEPLLKDKAERKTLGRVVIGTVAGDIHDIGKSLVALMLFSAGFEVIDLGKDVPIEEFVNAVKKYSPSIVGMSALITTTRPMQREVIEALKKQNLRHKVMVMVGGAPVSAEWAEEIGADGYAENAIEAVNVAKRLMGG